MKTILIACLLCCTGLLACSKKEHGEFVITGKIRNQADSTPYANQQIKLLYIWYEGGFTGAKEIRTVGKGYTDASGNFEILTGWYEAGAFYYIDDVDYGPRAKCGANGVRVDMGTVYK